MMSLKKMIRKPNQVLPQIIRRTSEVINLTPPSSMSKSESPEISKLHTSGPVPEGLDEWVQYKKVHCKRFLLKTISPDNFVVIGESIYKVNNILMHEGQIRLVCSKVTKVGTLFSYPVSSEFVGLITVDTEVENGFEVKRLDDVKSKCVVLPYQNLWVAIPMLPHWDAL